MWSFQGVLGDFPLFSLHKESLAVHLLRKERMTEAALAFLATRNRLEDEYQALLKQLAREKPLLITRQR